MYFKQMVKLLGIQLQYYAPRESKQYDLHGELDTCYYAPISVGGIYQGEVTQKTAKKLGWNAELSAGSILVTVPYDLDRLQVGALFRLPSAIDGSEGRLFKVLSMNVIAVYPSEITCELGPVLESTLEKSETQDFSKSNFNILKEYYENDD